MAMFFSFRGRVGRQEYWLAVILGWVVLFAAAVLMADMGSFGPWVAGLLYLLVLWAMLAMLVRRIHDRGRSGWWLLPMAGPVVVLNALAGATSAADEHVSLVLQGLALPFSLWILVDLGCLPGTRGPNRFGAPLSRPGDAAEIFD
jgi:uncharacterized membrane protein YhaH (DUF805 family)